MDQKLQLSNFLRTKN